MESILKVHTNMLVSYHTYLKYLKVLTHTLKITSYKALCTTTIYNILASRKHILLILVIDVSSNISPILSRYVVMIVIWSLILFSSPCFNLLCTCHIHIVVIIYSHQLSSLRTILAKDMTKSKAKAFMFDPCKQPNFFFKKEKRK